MKTIATKLFQRLAYLRKQPSEKYFHFEIRHPSPFKRPPLHQTIMVDDLKLMYLPIAKNACSSVKRITAELGGLSIADNEDIHRKLDNENTGLLFVNRSDDDIYHALEQSGWMRFVILRDPLERLVSAYVEKFVVNRLNPGVTITCDPVLMRRKKVGWLRADDYERGISFAEFVEDILSQPPYLLDPHWRPQSEYLRNFPHTHIYNLKNLGVLLHDLSRHIGQEIKLPRLNASRGGNWETIHVNGAAHMLPGDLPNPNHISVDSFLDGKLRDRVVSYFEKDIELVKSV
jgi:hypothetical protein